MHNLVYTKTDDISCLEGFHCGIYEMDSYIQGSLQSKLDTYKELDNYIISENNIVVALCTLRNNKLRIASGGYIDTVEIEYLAVRREVQNQGIGRDIINWIINTTRESTPEIRFITVDAFISDVTAYTAVPFYKKCGFKAIEKRHPMSEVVKMIRIIEPA